MPKLANSNHEKLARKAAKAILNSNTEIVKTDIYQDAYGCSRDSARSSAAVVFALPSVQKRIEEIIRLKNPEEEISLDLARLRKLKKPIVSDGRIIGEMDDGSTQLGAVTACLKVYGAFNDSNTTNIDARSVTINLDASDVKRLEDVARMMQELRAVNGTKSGVVGVGVDEVSPSP